MIQSQRAKEFDVYLRNEQPVGKWPLEIGGKIERYNYYKFPVERLIYNVNNGRLGMERQDWETNNGRQLDPFQFEDANIICDMLLKLDPQKTKDLEDDLHQKGQLEPGVITYDGVVINANRRMAVLSKLHKNEPGGKWEYLEAIRLPYNVGEKDLWRIEAGLQLSADRIAEYHPVNELLKIKEGVERGLKPDEIAAAIYGRNEDEVRDSLERLKYIESFLEFFGQPKNYGLIKKFGLHEYFQNIQKSIVKPAKNNGVSKREINEKLTYTFALIQAHIRIQSRNDEQGKRKKAITHFDIRKMGKILNNVHAKDEYINYLGNAKEPKKIISVDPETVIEGYLSASEVLENQEEKDKPVKLIKRAVKALESVDTTSDHFDNDQVRDAMIELSELVRNIESRLKKVTVQG